MAGANNQPQGAVTGKAMEAALKRAKETGNLNLQGRQLKVFPKEIITFSELQVTEKFWESWDLVKIDLSNNQIESIPEEIAS